MWHQLGHETGGHRVPGIALALGLALLWAGSAGAAGSDIDQSYDAVLVDATGLKTEVTNMVFYWEEKLSETQLALHELKHVPAKRGAVPIQIQFAKIKQIEFSSGEDHGEPVLVVTLKNGKSGTFTLEIPGSFKGQTDFGEMIAAPSQLQRIVFK